MFHRCILPPSPGQWRGQYTSLNRLSTPTRLHWAISQKAVISKTVVECKVCTSEQRVQKVQRLETKQKFHYTSSSALYLWPRTAERGVYMAGGGNNAWWMFCRVGSIHTGWEEWKWQPISTNCCPKLRDICTQYVTSINCRVTGTRKT
jgi:hypothetical protein